MKPSEIKYHFFISVKKTSLQLKEKGICIQICTLINYNLYFLIN